MRKLVGGVKLLKDILEAIDLVLCGLWTEAVRLYSLGSTSWSQPFCCNVGLSFLNLCFLTCEIEGQVEASGGLNGVAKSLFVLVLDAQEGFGKGSSY